jgi:3-oxoadipate enol-lactonase
LFNKKTTTMKKAILSGRQMEIAYDDFGAGEPLVLLHAFPLDRTMWEPQLRGLADGYRVLAFDFPGFGESGAATEGFTIEALADITADFLDAIGITGAVVAIGLSMGGYVALALARQHPHRLRGLILADTKAEPDDEAAKAVRDEMANLVRTQGVAGLMDRLLPKLVSDGARSQLLEQVRSIAQRQSVATIVFALLALRDRPDATPGLAHVTVPTLVLVGENDAITPPQTAMALAERILGAVQVTVLGAGHLTNLEAPEEFNNQVRKFVHWPNKK